MTLETHYRAYLNALNEHRLDDLVHYVQDEVQYNGRAWTRDQYRDNIAGDIAAIPDLFFHAEIVVADENQVACRIRFDCTPEQEFLGFTPNGKRLSFTEHVFYRFVDHRIAEVWSMIDRPAIAAQLAD